MSNDSILLAFFSALNPILKGRLCKLKGEKEMEEEKIVDPDILGFDNEVEGADE